MSTHKEKLKILYIITKSNWGGAQKHVFDLAKEAKEDFDVFVAFGGNGLLKQKLDEIGIKNFEITNFQRDISIFKEIKAFFEISKIVKNIRPDVIHLHSSKAVAMGSLAGKLLGVKKIIITIHGWAFKEKRNWLKNQIIYFISWLNLMLTNKAIMVSNDDLQKAPTFLIKNKNEIIRNGIGDLEMYSREHSKNALLPNLKKDCVWIGTIAELHKNKGLEYGIKAIIDIKKTSKEDLEKFIWVIISDGEEKNKLQKMIEENGLNENIFLVGQKTDAYKYLKAFDIFMLTSIKEGFPYALLEAGYAGLPVIATDVGDSNAVIKDMETGILIKPGDYKEIAYAIRHLIQNPEIIKKLGGAIEEKVKKEFSLKEMTEKIFNLYKN
jgi:glycosyltransferase involved in cell wall biosynthesis